MALTLWRMAMGIRDLEQPPLWIAASDLPVSPGHPFYTRVNALLDADGFDAFVEHLCRAFYAPVLGRPSLAPGRYFRLLLIGYFEGIGTVKFSGSVTTGRRRSSIRTKAPSSRPRRLRRCSRPTRWPSAWDGKGRWVDNVFVERLWRSVKYEDVYLHAYETPASLRAGLTCYFQFYNGRRRHSSLGRRTPDVVYFGTTGFGTAA